MNLARVAFAFAAPLTLSLAAVSAPAYAQGHSAYERAVLAGLDSSTRAEVTRRAAGGDTVSGVVAVILLNNYQAAGATAPGEALTVVAVDFERGTVVLRKGAEELVLHRFDRATLRMTP